MVNATKADLLHGEDYIATILSAIEKAQKKIWSSFFIMSLTSETKHLERIKEIADTLVMAKARGIDVRIILSKFETGDFDFDINRVALAYLQEHGLQVKQYHDNYRTSSHCKDWIFDDDYQIAGSGNLSIGGLFNNMETAIIVQSTDLNVLLSERYLRIWENSTFFEYK